MSKYKIKLEICKDKNNKYFYDEYISSEIYIKYVKSVHEYYNLFGIKCKKFKSKYAKPYNLYICPESFFFLK